MSTAKVIEIIAESADSFEDAIRNGISTAEKSLENVRSAWVAEQKVCVTDGKISSYRVTMRVAFVLNE